MNKLLVILLIIFFLPTVASFEITNTKFTIPVIGEEITQIPHDLEPNQIIGYFEVEYKGEFRSQINANLSSIYRFVAYDYSNEQLNCVAIEDGARCTNSVPYRIYTDQPNNELHFRAGILTDNYTHTFNIKTTNPEIRRIDVQECDDCHIRTGEIYIVNFHFNQEEKFDRGLFFGFITPEATATNDCEGNTCEGTITAACNNGPVNLLVDPTSKNNPGQYVSGVLSKQLTCDNDAPIIQSVTLEEEIIETNQNINVKINVTDAIATKLDFEFKIDSISYSQNVSCTNKQAQKFVCDININLQDSYSNPLTPSSYNLEIIARDNAKNSARNTTQITILESDETTITNWEVSSEVLAHPSMNVETLIFPRETYLETTLRSTTNMRLRDVQINSNNCLPVSQSNGQQGNIQNFNIVDFTEDKIITKFTVQSYGSNNRYQNISQLKFKCPATIYSRTPNSIIQQPQQINLTITIDLRSSPRLDMMLTESLEKRVEEVQETTKTINTLRTIFDATAFVCGATTGIHGIFTTVGVAMQSVEAATATLQTVPVAGQAVGETTKGMTTGIIEGYGSIREKIKRDWAICTLFTCERSLGLDLLPADFLGESTVPALAGINSSQLESLTLDPYKSIVTASATLCLPAVMYHIERFQSVHCEYIECLAEGVAMQGIDPTFCREAKTMAQCVMLAESVTNLVVPYDILQRAITNVRNYLSNPGAAISGALFTHACRPNVQWFGAGICTTFQSATSLYESGRTIYNLGQAVFSPAQNACDRSLAVVTAYQDYFNDPHLHPMPSLQSAETPSVSSEFVPPQEFTKTIELADDKVGFCVGKNCGLFNKDGFDSENVDWDKNLVKDGNSPINVFDERSKMQSLRSTHDIGPAEMLEFRRAVEGYHKDAIENAAAGDVDVQEWFEKFEQVSLSYEDANEEIETTRTNLQSKKSQLENYQQVVDNYNEKEANILDGTMLTRDELLTVREITLRGKSQGGLNDEDMSIIQNLETSYGIDVLDSNSQTQQTINQLTELENQRDQAQEKIPELSSDVDALQQTYDEEVEKLKENFPDQVADEELRRQRNDAARSVFEAEDKVQNLNKQLTELSDQAYPEELVNQINQDISDAQNRIQQINAQRDILINDPASYDPETGEYNPWVEAELTQLFTEVQSWEDNIQRNEEGLERSEAVKEEITELEQQLTQAELELQQAEAEFDETTRELSGEEADDEESEAELLLREQFNSTYGTVKFLYGSQRGFAIIDKYLPLGNNDWSDLNLGFIGLGRLGGLNLGFMNNVVQGLEQASNFERMICQNMMRNERTFSDEFQLIQNSGAGFRLGAYLTGKRISTTDPLTEETTYTYIVGGTVNPNKEAEFELILRTNSGESLIITENITRNTRLNPGVNNPIGSMSNQGYVTLKEQYTEVCMGFTEPLVDLFDLVRGLGPGGIRQLRNDAVCVDIQVES